MKIKICWQDKAVTSDLLPPEYQTAGASGLDIRAAIKKEMVLSPQGIILVPTGFSLEIPEGFEAQVRPRSGLATRYGVTVINSPGTIDADYRGEIKVPLINHGKEAFLIKRGDRIAQLVFAPVCRVELIDVEILNQTRRGSDGFGHTGR